MKNSDDNFEVFSEDGQNVMRLTEKESSRLNHDYIGTEHILLGLINDPSCTGMQAIRQLGRKADDVRREIETIVRPGTAAGILRRPLTPRAKTSLEFAREESRDFPVDSGHLLLGLLHEREGVACHVLNELGLDLERVREELMKISWTMED